MRGKTSIAIDGVDYVVMPEMRNGMIVWRKLK